MASQVQVKGLSTLLDNMKHLPSELVSRNGGPVKTALLKAAKVIREDARNRAPVDTGLLRKNIIASRNPDPKKLGVNELYMVMVRKARRLKRKNQVGKDASSDPFYWRFLEFGTRNAKARPFLRPAFESKKNESVEVFKTELTAGIQRIVSKMKKT